MLELICSNLEIDGWSESKNFISKNECNQILHRLKELEEDDVFSEGGVSRQLKLKRNSDIRRSQIHWIEDWNSTESLNIFRLKLNELMINLNAYFFLSMKRFESQFSIYNEGDFYKKHIDQHSTTRHRQVSTILYLDDCLKGGELVLYKRDSKNTIDRIITPKKGTLVTFFSSQIYHEVLETKDIRYGLTSWMRDDELVPLI